MQNGFFDDLLNTYGVEEEKEEVKEETSNDVVENTETGELVGGLDSAIPSFDNVSFETENVKEETPIVEEVKNEVKEETEKPKKEATRKSKKAENLVSEPKTDNSPKESAKVENTKNNTSQTTNALKPKDMTALLIESTLSKINDIVSYSNEVFTTKAKECASDIIVSLSHTLNERGYSWNQIDAKGSGLIMQIKRWAKLGIDVTTDKLYGDIRNNSKTGLYDIKVKGQYQTVEKLIIKYCSKRIFRFKTEVICIGDELKTDFDYALGEEKILGFTKNEEINRNLLDNIIGAFKIAYYSENGQVKQIVTQIDKNRIMRAYETASTKNVWNRDTQKMVKKTVTWEMWNSEDIRPFMDFPEDIIQDLAVVNESEDVDFNKEHKYQNVVDVQNNVEETIGSGESVEI